MHTASIPTTLTLEQDGVTIFEADCILEVTYSVDREIGHSGYYVDDWRIDEIIFEENYRSKERATITKGHPWFDNLCALADADHIEEKLTQHMMDYAS